MSTLDASGSGPLLPAGRAAAAAAAAPVSRFFGGMLPDKAFKTRSLLLLRQAPGKKVEGSGCGRLGLGEVSHAAFYHGHRPGPLPSARAPRVCPSVCHGTFTACVVAWQAHRRAVARLGPRSQRCQASAVNLERVVRRAPARPRCAMQAFGHPGVLGCCKPIGCTAAAPAGTPVARAAAAPATGPHRPATPGPPGARGPDPQPRRSLRIDIAVSPLPTPRADPCAPGGGHAPRRGRPRADQVFSAPAPSIPNALIRTRCLIHFGIRGPAGGGRRPACGWHPSTPPRAPTAGGWFSPPAGSSLIQFCWLARVPPACIACAASLGVYGRPWHQ
jgi:hypothetical protein